MSLNTKSIVIYNEKGGVGKTTITFLLYKHYPNKYFVIQTDKYHLIEDSIQITSLEQRKDKDLIEKIIKLRETKHALNDLGGFEKQLHYNFLEKKDLLIVPMILDKVNIKTTLDFLLELKFLGYLKEDKTLIIFNKFTPDQKKLEDLFKQYLKEAELNNINNFFRLSNYKSYISSFNYDINIFEEEKKNKRVYASPAREIRNLNKKVEEMIK